MKDISKIDTLEFITDDLIQERSGQWSSYSGFQLEMRHGFKLELRSGCDYSRRRFVYRIAEPYEINFLQQNYSKVKMETWVCADVGANIGYWSKALAEVFNVKKVYSFEPDPETYSICKRNIENNSNVDLFETALGSYEGNLDLYIDPADSGDSTAQPILGRKNIKVKLRRFDIFCLERAITQLDFLKIDIQGGEIDFFKGAEKTLRTLRPLIMVEIMSDTYDGISEFVSELASLYKYEIFMINEDGPKQYKASELRFFDGNSNAFLIPC